MKLSERLAANAPQARKVARDGSMENPPPKKPGAQKTPRAQKTQTSWTDAKRKVRDMVLAEVGPKLFGAKAIRGEALEKEVKAILDRIVRTQDVKVSPVQRAAFVAEVISDTLGYGPLDGPLSDTSVTEIMCNAYDEIFVERAGLIEQTDLSFGDEEQYRQVIDKIVSAVGRRMALEEDLDRKSTRLNSSHLKLSRMPSSA